LGIFEEFYKAREAGVRNAEHENSLGPNSWKYYGRGIDDYGDVFKGVLNGLDFRKFLAEFSKNRPVFSLDAMGDGQVIREIAASDHMESRGGIALTLTDMRDDTGTGLLRQFDRDHRISVVTGNVWAGSSWRKVRSVAGQFEDFHGFDLIFLVPVGAWSTSSDWYYIPHLGLQYLLTSKLWQLLSPRGGVLFASFPPSKNDCYWNDFSSWVTNIESAIPETKHYYHAYEGIPTDEWVNVMMLQKTSDEARLPSPY
jgi:hypothetical protein